MEDIEPFFTQKLLFEHAMSTLGVPIWERGGGRSKEKEQYQSVIGSSNHVNNGEGASTNDLQVNFNRHVNDLPIASMENDSHGS